MENAHEFLFPKIEATAFNCLKIVVILLYSLLSKVWNACVKHDLVKQGKTCVVFAMWS